MKKSFFTFPKVFALLTIVLGGLPLLIYLIERKSGLLPNSDSWYAAGTNHGPWRNGLEGLTIYYTMLILLIATLIAFVSRGIRERRRSLLVFGLLLVIIQLTALASQMHFLAWTID
jgi:hypothetical protein